MVEVNLLSLIILLVIMLFLLLSIFLYLLTKKITFNQNRARINHYKEEYRLELFLFLQSGKSVSFDFQTDQEKFIACKELLQEYANVIASEEMKERIKEFAKEHYTSYISKELKRKQVSLRMNALYLVEEFEMTHLTNLLEKLYKKRKITVLEKAQLLKLFALFDDKKLVEYIKCDTDVLSDFSLMDVLSVTKEERIKELVESLDDLPTRLQFIVVEVIGNRQLVEYHQLLLTLINQSKEDVELKIRTFKAIVLLGLQIDSKLMTEALESEHWQLRMMASRLAGVHRLATHKEKLISLLKDREYAVRAEAAKAILKFKDGVTVLKRVVVETNDPFAKDMATEWLEKESVFY